MVGTMIATAAFGAAAAGTLAYAATVFAVNFAVSLIVSRVFGQDQQGAQDNGVRQQVPPSNVNAIPIVYGDAFLGGTFVDAALTTDQKTMYYVLAVSSISPNGQFAFDQSQFYYGDRLVTFDASGAGNRVIKLTDEAGNQDTKIDGNLWIYLFKSNEAGTITPINTSGTLPSGIMSVANGLPAGTAWTGTRQMNGLAFAIVQLRYNQDAGTTSLSPVTFKVSQYLNGTGAAKPGDVWYDYMTNTRYGGAINANFVDAASAATLNTYADQTITFQTYTGSPSTQPRYRINGVLDAGQQVINNVDKIMTCCDSWMAYNADSGKWSVVVNKAEAAAYAFDDENIIGEIRVSATDITQSVNQVEGKFPNKENRDQPDFVNLKTPDILLYPNEPVNKYSVTYDLVNDSVRAQYLANRVLEQAREDLIVSFSTTYYGIQVDAGSVVSVTNSDYGWTNKLFRVVKVNEASLPDGSLGAKLELSEYSAAVYDDANITEYTPVPNSNIPSPVYFSTVAAPSVLASRPNAQIPSFDVRVTIPAVGRVTIINLYYTTSATPTTADWKVLAVATQSNAQPYTNSATFDFLNQVLPTGTYYFGVIVANNLGQSVISGLSTAFAWAPITTGSRNVYPTLYQWSATQPANPTGTSVFTWATGTQVYDNVDAWRVTAPANPGTGGLQLWEALKWLNDTTGNATTTFSWTVGGTNVQSIGQNGTSGTPGATGPRSASGFLYYGFASGSAPSQPSASGFDFTNGSFSSVTFGWSTSFSMPSTNVTDTNNNRFWAVRYAVSEATFGGAQTVTISSVFNWTNFDGLVTFSNMSSPSGTNPSGGVTFIDGGHIIAETLTVDRLESGTTTTQSGNTFGFGSGSAVSGVSTCGFFQTTRSDTLALAAMSSNNVAFIGSTVANTVAGGFGNRYLYGINDIASGNNITLGSFGHPLYGAFIQRRTQGGSAGYVTPDGNTKGYVKIAFNEASIDYAFQAIYGPTGYYALLGTPYYALYTSGPVGPFTGSHDGVMDKSISPTPGDILVDLEIVAKKGVSDTVTSVEPSSSASQANVIGVFVGISDQIPTAMAITIEQTVEGIDGPIETTVEILNPIYDTLMLTNNYVIINSVGEGQVNVCGLGGDIQKGDLICSSAMLGKGMKQADDIFRSYTVAKARESVTFNTPEEVKQIACTYHSG